MRRILLLTFALALASSGCHMAFVGMVAGTSTANGVYQAGAIGHELGDASVRTVGCLDVGLALVNRPDRDTASYVQLNVGNRCSHPEALDFSKVRVHGVVFAGGAERPITLDDPRSEIVELRVGGGERGRELIRMNGAAEMVGLTFDLNAVAPDAPHAHPASLHFARESTHARWAAVL